MAAKGRGPAGIHTFSSILCIELLDNRTGHYLINMTYTRKRSHFKAASAQLFFMRFFLSSSLELFKFLKWKNAGIFILPTNYRHIQVVLKALLNSNLSPPSQIGWGATFLWSILIHKFTQWFELRKGEIISEGKVKKDLKR